MGKALIIKGTNFSAVAVEQITIGESVPCTGISLSPSTASATRVNDTVTITPTVLPNNTTDTIVWTSSDDRVASVNNGIITIHGIGTATITASGTGNKNAVIKLDHNTLTPTPTDNTTAANQTAINTDNGFTAITALGFDDYGHVSSYTNQRYTLPDDVFVTLTGGVSGSNNTATVAFDLKDKGDESRKGTGANVPTFSMSTSSLKIVTTAATASAPGNIAIDLEWGTF